MGRAASFLCVLLVIINIVYHIIQRIISYAPTTTQYVEESNVATSAESPRVSYLPPSLFFWLRHNLSFASSTEQSVPSLRCMHAQSSEQSHSCVSAP